MKDPFVLDFLDLPEAYQLRQRDIETAILDKLQQEIARERRSFELAPPKGAT